MKKRTKIKLKSKEESNGEILRWRKKEVRSKNFHMRGKDKGKKVHMKNKEKDRKILTSEKDKDSKHLHSSEIMIEGQIKIQDKALAAKKGNFSNQDRSKKVQKRKVLLTNVQVCKIIC